MTNPRLNHALTYSILRSLEIDLHREIYSFIHMGNKLKHAFFDGENKTRRGGDSILYPSNPNTHHKESTPHHKEPATHRKEFPTTIQKESIAKNKKKEERKKSR